MFKKISSFLIIFLFAIVATAASIQDDFNSNMKDFNFINKSKNVTRFSYKMVADKFLEIYEKNPKSALGEKSLYYAAETYNNSYQRFQNSIDQAEALKYYKLLASNYKSSLSANAHLKAAEIYIQMKDIPTAQFMYENCIKKFPKSKESKIAQQQLTLLNKKYSATSQPSPRKNPQITKNDKEKTTQENIKNQDEQKSDALDYENKAPRVEIKSVKYWSNDDYTRVVIELSGKAHFYKHWLKENPEFHKPPRLFVDIYNSVINPSIPKNMDINDGLLKGLRWGIYEKYTTRVVLDIDSVNDFTVFQMENPYRIVIDVSKDNLNKVTAGETKSEPKEDKKQKSKGKVTLVEGGDKHTLASAFGLKVKTIVLDPGHGGKDPGATYNGLMEKDMNLDIALRVKQKLEKYDSALKILMTRDTDVFIPLEERTAFANKNKADIFVSIHQNASRNPDAHGIETYVLNVTKDKSALAVAAFENQASEKSISDLQGILKDIMLNSKLEESLMLANFVQKSLSSSTADRDIGVKQAPFYVLVGAKMPSILIECGFISNPHTAQLYTTEEYKNKMAEGIFNGLLKYIEHYNGK
ncbi:N-acetylmuramoyl-L-alanine amidase [Calditerrivibrio nitroreducens]|uniref:N-acetylmuramoyl-L-alanine amidase n=1 Tax=Calditerrivibrio nitroreducens (strain DSM 19672 / NBRC 101217 / Yu37-1) TaxID=768670 RepID=E4THU7_CALNY|nr:N-acetylmuramoyl-L-alanine amidase [Calditerrivibrio nitroreducens]ADR19958.1 cell wall hydrolase/autolysin [Calditerrivibrio nitroreducens DSM 19672]